MLREVSLVDGLDVGPVVLDSDFFEFSLVLVMPGAHSPTLLLREGTGAGEIVLATVAHLDVLGNKIFVSDFGVALDNSEVLLVLAHGHGGQVAAFKLGFIEAVEVGERHVLVLLVIEGPTDPLLVFLHLEVFEQAQIDIHC